MDGKHTPLPWVVEQGECNPLIVAHTKYGPLVVAEVLDDVYPDTDGQQANARLIAAAPEMLAACKAARDYLTPAGGVPVVLVNELNALIARVEGRS